MHAALGQNLKQGIFAQTLVVVEVLIAQRDAEDALGQEGPLRMGDEERIAGIDDTGVEGVDQTHRAIHLAQEQGSPIGGQPTATKVGLDVLTFEACKQEGFGGTVCHSNGLSV